MYVENPRVSCRELGESLILHDSSNGKTLRLNRSAALIFLLCDGQHDEDAMLERLGAIYEGHDPSRLRADLTSTLSHLEREQVIVRTRGG